MLRVLVTGSTGMVGKNLLDHASAQKFNVLAPSSLELDLCNYELVLDYITRTKPSVVVHAAGRVGGIQANINEPVAFLDDNLLIGRNVVIAALNAGVRNFINLGSTCMYPRNVQNPLREDLILTGELEPTNEGYALAKVVVAKLCEYITKQNPALHYKTIVPCNLYGLYDKFSPDNSHLVPAIIHKIHEAKETGNETVEIWGDGQARREFMYAGDLADAIWRSVEEIKSLPNIFNCGLGYDYSVNEYYEAAAEVIGWKGTFTHLLDKPVGMKQKLADISRQKIWGWSPTTSLKHGLELTYQHYLTRSNL